MAASANIDNPPIPVLKERKVTGLDAATGLINSYKIKNSYCGILRLSPNSSGTFNEVNNFEPDENAEGIVYTSYIDSVANALKSQFVRVSTSDGIMLDMRISENAIEYNNLYVNGAVKTSSGVVCYMGEDDQFKIGNLIFPTTINSKDTNTNTAHDKLFVPTNRENIKDGYILVNTAEDGMPPVFEYLNAEELISAFVVESMSHMNCLPAGSIHWMPVTIQQYKELLHDSNNEHNGRNLSADSIIRDFLLCDGSVYNIKDFPELAKALYKEKVNYWGLESTASNAALTLKTANCVDVNAGTFRVPDFRAMFMQYLIPKMELWNAEGNRAGDYEIDSNKHPKHAVDIDLDKHYHYIVLDNSFDTAASTHTRTSYTPAQTSAHANKESAIRFGTAITYRTAAADNPDNGEIKGYHYSNKDGHGLEIFNPNGSKPLNRYGNGRTGAGLKASHGGAGGGGCHQKSCFGAHGGQGPSYVYTVYFSDRNCKVGGHTGGYFLSSSTRYKGNKDETLPLSDYHGISSWNFSMQVDNETLKANGLLLNYTTPGSGSIYENEKQYVSDVNGMVDMYGKENTPEYFACLPLIKI